MRRLIVAATAVFLLSGMGYSIDTSMQLTPGQPPPVVGKIDWTTSGASSWSGAPTPTIDCSAAATDGAFTCSGATASKQGSPTTSASPYYPSGFSGAQLTSNTVSNNSNYWDLGDVADVTTSLWFCAVARPTAAGVIFAKDANAPSAGTSRSYYLRYDGTSFLFRVFKTDAEYTTVTAAGSINAWNVVCGTFDGSGGDGSGIIRLQANTTVGTPSTTAISPAQSSNAPLLIGQYGWGGDGWDGEIQRVTLGLGVASASQLAQMVAGYQSLIASKPTIASTAWPRAGTPTVDCVAASSGGDLACSGLSVSKEGGAQTTSTSSYYPGYSAVTNGSTDYWSAGDTVDPLTSFTFCTVFYPTAAASDIISKFINPGHMQFTLWYNSDQAYFYVHGAADGSSFTRLDSGASTVALNTWHVLCASYLYGAGDTGVMRMQVDSTVPSPATSAKSIVADADGPLLIGGQNKFTGGISRATFWKGVAASADELSEMVAFYRSYLLAKTDPGLKVVWTRAATETVCPVSDGACYTVAAGTPAIGQYGAGVWPARRNEAPYSEPYEWSGGGLAKSHVTITEATTLAPNGGSASLVTDDAGTYDRYLAYLYTPFAEPMTYSVYAKAGTISIIALSIDYGTSWTWFDLSSCSAGTTGSGNTPFAEDIGGDWCRVGLTKTMPNTSNTYVTVGLSKVDGSINYNGDGAGTVYLWRAQNERGSYATPPIYQAGTLTTRPVTVASVSSQRAAGPGCIGGTFSSPNWSTSAKRWLLSQGTAEGANSLSLGLDASNNLVCDSYDAGATQKKAIVAQAFAANSSKALLCCWDGSSPSLYVDGALQASTVSGSGTGPASVGTMYIGSGSAAGASAFGGHVSKVLECKNARASACK